MSAAQRWPGSAFDGGPNYGLCDLPASVFFGRHFAALSVNREDRLAKIVHCISLVRSPAHVLNWYEGTLGDLQVCPSY